MLRAIAIVLLAAGTVFGFGMGFARLAGYGPCGYGWHGRAFYDRGAWGGPRQSFEDRAADACVRAAERVLNEPKKPAPATSPAPGGQGAPRP